MNTLAALLESAKKVPTKEEIQEKLEIEEEKE
jgi:hypothetical protein